MAIRWKKRFGQHLLHDRNILNKITAAAELSGDDCVIEIGCGSGALTEFLVASRAQVIGVEIDPQFYDLLQEKFKQHKTFTLITCDILEVELSTLLSSSKSAVIVGNLPYNISSQILFHLFEQRDLISRMLFMVQKEVAQRIVAPVRTKDRGILSAICQFHVDPEIAFHVSRNCFYPKPQVDSSVVSLKLKELVAGVKQEDFKQVVKTCFGKRRKTLKNSLTAYNIKNLEYISTQFDLNLRPETLEVEEFVALTKALCNKDLEETSVS